jgi:hypothetical protein
LIEGIYLLGFFGFLVSFRLFWPFDMLASPYSSLAYMRCEHKTNGYLFFPGTTINKLSHPSMFTNYAKETVG